MKPIRYKSASLGTPGALLQALPVLNKFDLSHDWITIAKRKHSPAGVSVNDYAVTCIEMQRVLVL